MERRRNSALSGFWVPKQAAVHQDAPGFGFEQAARAGDGSRGSAKANGDAHDAPVGTAKPPISRCNAFTKISSRVIALLGCSTPFVERIERMPARANSVRSSALNRAWVMMTSIAVAPAAASALAQAIKVPPEETMSSTRSTGRPASKDLSKIRSQPCGRRGASFAQPRDPFPAGPRDRSPMDGPLRPDRQRLFCRLDHWSAVRLRSLALPTDCRPRCLERRSRISAVR